MTDREQNETVPEETENYADLIDIRKAGLGLAPSSIQRSNTQGQLIVEQHATNLNDMIILYDQF